LHRSNAAIVQDVREDIQFDEQRKPVADVGKRLVVTTIRIWKYNHVDCGALEHHRVAAIEMSDAGLCEARG
jgi:hypothetical protein